MSEMSWNGNDGVRMRIKLISCVGVDHELELLPFFLDHYLALGIAPTDVRLIFNTRDAASPALDAADSMLRERSAPPARRWIGPYTSDAMWAHRRALQQDIATPGDWIVNADVDEFHRYPAPLEEIVRFLEEESAGSIQGVMIDRLSRDGSLDEVRSDIPLQEQFPLRADVSLSVIGMGENHGLAGTFKLMIHRHDVLPNRGGHTVHPAGAEADYATGVQLGIFPGTAEPTWRGSFPFQVDHYKWTANLPRSLARRLATPGVSVAGKEYGGKIDRYIATHGRIRLADASLFEGDAPRDPAWRARIVRMRRGSIYWRARSAVRRRVLALTATLRKGAGN